MKSLSKLFAFMMAILIAGTITANHDPRPKIKIDGGPVYMHLDFLTLGKVTKTMNMGGFRFDLNIRPVGGLVVKPVILYGKSKKSYVKGGNISVGHLIPIGTKILLLPSVGWNYSKIQSPVDMPSFPKEVYPEIFRSNGPLAGLDVYFNFAKNWRICASVQYIWSKTQMNIGSLFETHSKSKGPSWGIMIEKDFCESWSVNLGAAYNVSLSKELHGVRGAGVKLGIAKWF